IRLPERFWTKYGDAVGDRIVSSRLNHPDLPVDPPPQQRPWALRVADLDVLGHVNNAAWWAAVEDVLDRAAVGAWLVGAELEYRGPVDRTQATMLASRIEDRGLQVWLAADGSVLASARLTFG
ncbi:MAG: hypothetical protein QOG44_1003, partial [Acidimicrobiaceae bacterium]|nr:hypothetical protein [Acidimicrobiaceae bacterium]